VDQQSLSNLVSFRRIPEDARGHLRYKTVARGVENLVLMVAGNLQTTPLLLARLVVHLELLFGGGCAGLLIAPLAQGGATRLGLAALRCY
jgi:hypothetical protein